MRAVKFKRWIGVEFDPTEEGNIKKGTGSMSESLSGKFLQWGFAVAFEGNTTASYSIAIVEDENGAVHQVMPENLVFVEPEKSGIGIIGQLEHTSKNKQEILDQFASAALTALIAKMPFYDSNGEYGKEINIDELQAIKKQLTRVAYEYAGWMMGAREEFKKWLKDCEAVNPDFGS